MTSWRPRWEPTEHELCERSSAVAHTGFFFTGKLGETHVIHDLSGVAAKRVLLVGGGDEAVGLKRQAAALGMDNHVVFTGRVHHSEVVRYYDLIDVLVYPRVNMRLTDLVTPLKPLEAMAQDKIIIASDVGGHHELITDGKTGNLFRADDPASLADTVVGVLDRRALWPEQRAHGRRYVETERSWSAVVERYVDVYGDLEKR